MSRLTAFLLGLAVSLPGTAVAERVVTECKVIAKPDLKPCSLELYFERKGEMPNRCFNG